MPSAEFRLGLRTLYIIPSRFGMVWLATAALLLVVAIQTASNSTFLIAFVLLGLMFLAMFLTHDNLQGITLRCGESSPGFASEPINYHLVLHSPTARQRMQLRFQGQPPHQLDQLEAGETRAVLSWTAGQRGWQLPPRLLLDCVAPLGLFICWTRWQPPKPQLIWPARRRGPVQDTSLHRRRDGLDEWNDLRPLRPGERPALVDWAGVAKGRPKQVKLFRDPGDAERMLSPSPGLPWNLALEHLAERIWQLHHRGERYGLQLRGRTLAPASGVDHRDACLALLALA